RRVREGGQDAPDEAALRSDWALCLQKAGQRARAIEENLAAIRLSVLHRAEPVFDYAGDRVRESSYFNLRSLKFQARPPGGGDSSGALRVPGCGANLEETSWDQDLGGSGGATTLSYLRVAIAGGPP